MNSPGFSIPAWFIGHPIATTLLTFAVLLGVFAWPPLPGAPPQAEFPMIGIRANVPGASADTMASAVVTPLETQLDAVPGIAGMTSSTTPGAARITVQFARDKNIDAAAQDVQAAIDAASGHFPADMPSLPTWRKVHPSDGVPDNAVLVLGVQSPSMPPLQLGDLAETRLARNLRQVPGVSQVSVVVQHPSAIRIQASPDRLAALGLTMADLRNAAHAARVDRARHSLVGERGLPAVGARDPSPKAEDYARRLVTYRNGSPVPLGDAANVMPGADNGYVPSWPNGKPGVALVVMRAPGANIIETADAALARLHELQRDLPASVEALVINDRSRAVRASLHDAQVTLAVAVLLVVLVIGVFLRRLPARLMVGAVLAVALLATFATLYAAGFSLDNLMRVVLLIAVGVVVDDAIVVIENIHREGASSIHDRVLKDGDEMTVAVISIGLSLIAALVSLLIVGGRVGRLFSEFAPAVIVAILLPIAAWLTVLDARANRGLSPQSAFHDASLTRSRPITTVAIVALLAAVQSMIGSGTGSEPRQWLGAVATAGLLISQVVLMRYAGPVVYLALDRRLLRLRRGRELGHEAVGEASLTATGAA